MLIISVYIKPTVVKKYCWLTTNGFHFTRCTSHLLLIFTRFKTSLGVLRSIKVKFLLEPSNARFPDILMAIAVA